MTPKSLFNIILKILGIFFIKDILVSISQIVSAIPIFISSNSSSSDTLWMLLSAIITLIIYSFIAFLLIAKSELIINWLKLDKGFDQQSIPLNIHRSTILSISLLVLGGVVLIEEIPKLCQQVIAYFQIKRSSLGMMEPSISYSVVAGVKIMIALILIIYQRHFVNFIEVRRKK